MSEPKLSTEVPEMTRDEMMSALFAHMIVQQSNLAMMLMGKVNHPETGKPVRDLEAARLFIDQLEMLEAKTKGNLSKNEEQLLKQSLMNLRLAFVESVNAPATPESTEGSKPTEPATAPAEPPPEVESHKKFSKKY